MVETAFFTKVTITSKECDCATLIYNLRLHYLTRAILMQLHEKFLHFSRKTQKQLLWGRGWYKFENGFFSKIYHIINSKTTALLNYEKKTTNLQQKPNFHKKNCALKKSIKTKQSCRKSLKSKRSSIDEVHLFICLI